MPTTRYYSHSYLVMQYLDIYSDAAVWVEVEYNIAMSGRVGDNF